MTSSYTPMKSIDFLVVHCSATKAGMDIGRKEIDQWHRQRGFIGIGYHYVIRRDGSVEKGRPDDQPGAHAVEVNSRSLGICMVGGVAKDGKTAENNFTEAQFTSLFSLLRMLSAMFPNAQILGHRDIPKVAKDCPSFDVRAWWRAQQQET